MECTRPINPLPNLGPVTGGSSVNFLGAVAGVGLAVLAGTAACLGAYRLVGAVAAAAATAALAGGFMPGLAIAGFLGESGSLSTEETEAIDVGLFKAAGFAAPVRAAADLAPEGAAAPPAVAPGFPFAGAAGFG